MHRRHLIPTLTALVVGALLATSPTPALAAGDPGPVHPIVFPVIGKVSYTDTFGAARSGGRSHEGQDLLGAKMLEVVSASPGRVTYITQVGALAGNMVQVTAPDGWVYSYLHLNNDTPGTDDGAATAEQTFGPGIVKGATVTAGQLIGYLGDSGNAETTAPHLHFEMKDPSGVTVNAYASLQAASQVATATGSAPSPIPRLAGADRVATAIELSKAGWPGGSPDVVLAAGDRYAEALPASVLASTRNGPLLLSSAPTLEPAVAAELTRLGARNVTVVGSVPAAVADGAAAGGRTVNRVGTPGDATATAAAVAGAVGGAARTAVLVNGDRFPDGVSATTVAAGRGWPVLLTTERTVPQSTVDTWRTLGITKLVIVGGTSVVGDNVQSWIASSGRCAGAAGCAVERLSGPDRYATSVAAVERSLALGGRSVATVLLGTGTAYADVLASGPLAARLGGLALLVDGTGSGADAASRAFLAARAGAVQRASILGGTLAVGGVADRALQAALGLG